MIQLDPFNSLYKARGKAMRRFTVANCLRVLFLFIILSASSIHAQTTVRAGFGALYSMFDLEVPHGSKIEQKLGIGGSVGVDFEIKPNLSVLVQGSTIRTFSVSTIRCLPLMPMRTLFPETWECW